MSGLTTTGAGANNVGRVDPAHSQADWGGASNGPQWEGASGGTSFSDDGPVINDIGDELKNSFDAALASAGASLGNAATLTAAELEELERQRDLLSQPGTAAGNGQGSLILSIIQKLGASSNAAALATLEEKRLEILEKDRRLKDLAGSLQMMGVIVESLPADIAHYNHSLALLENHLSVQAAYLDYKDLLADTITATGWSYERTMALVNDPLCQHPDVLPVRKALQGLVNDPVIGPLFNEVEQRHMNIARAMESANDLVKKSKGIEGLDLSGFSKIAPLAESLASSVEFPSVTRPGGPVVTGKDNEMAAKMKELAASIREMVSTIMGAFSGLTRKAGASPSI